MTSIWVVKGSRTEEAGVGLGYGQCGGLVGGSEKCPGFGEMFHSIFQVDGVTQMLHVWYVYLHLP